MNLLSLIIVFLALLVCGSIAYIAWELTSERSLGKNDTESRDEGSLPSPPLRTPADTTDDY